ncbi:MAG: 30S ribosomal protein S3 [candidate division Zixibacteria bacterium]|nr:30S ribosomal protein S3 [candidate division Zixibacteria bacterium]
MGQKTHPIGFRLGVNKSWNSKWFARGRDFSDFLFEDMQIRRYVNSRLSNASVAKVGIKRDPRKVTVDIHTSRPGIVIGRKGAEVDKLREELHLLTKRDITLNIVEVKRPELSAKLVADSIASQLSGRVAYRRAMKRALAATMKMGAQGIKIICGGRLAGAEIARTEKYHEGRVPLHTLRSDIDYASSTSRTTYGAIGVKVWICKGEIMDRGDFSDKDEKSDSQMSPELAAMADRKGRRRGGDDSRRRSTRVRGRVRRGPKRGPGGPGDGPRDSSREPSRDASKSGSEGGGKPSGDTGKRQN